MPDRIGTDAGAEWTLHGAWSGVGRDGSYTDCKGPYACAETVRFFLEQSRAGSADPF